MSISIIVAIAERNAIGKNNQLLLHIPDDLKRFKRITSGHKVIMGKKTYESLPVKPLPGRENIVISDDMKDHFEGCIMAWSIDDAIKLCMPDEECFVIGGGMIYRQFMRYADKLYITRVFKSFDADTFFPDIDLDEWDETERITHPPDEKNDFAYAFIIYVRKK